MANYISPRAGDQRCKINYARTNDGAQSARECSTFTHPPAPLYFRAVGLQITQNLGVARTHIIADSGAIDDCRELLTALAEMPDSIA
jgi:hypothetical protein